MSDSVNCQACKASFPLQDWVRYGTCPACGQRVATMAAAGMGAAGAAGTAAPAAPPAPPPTDGAAAQSTSAEARAAAARAVAGAAATLDLRTAASLYAPVAATFDEPGWAAGQEKGTYMGMPLRWSAGFSVVLVIWALFAVLLAGERVHMGNLPVLSPAEEAALQAVKRTKVAGTSVSNEQVLDYMATHDYNSIEGIRSTSPQTATWYVSSRPWEHTTYLTWYLPGQVVLSWTVIGSKVEPDPATGTAREMQKWQAWMAHPPGPSLPGVLPSIPTGL